VDVEELAALEERLIVLEELVGAITIDTNPDHSVCRRTEQATERLAEISDRFPHIGAFWSKVKNEKNLALEVEVGLDSLAKVEYIIAVESEIKRIGNSLKAIAENEKYINPESLKDVPKITIQLNSLQSTHLDQIQTSRAQSKQFQELCNSYNKIIELLNAKFLYWDGLLTQWEQTLDAHIALQGGFVQ